MVRNTLLFLALAAAAGPALAQSDDAASKWSGLLALPAALGFLTSVGGNDVAYEFTPEKYVMLIVYMMLAFGVGFEFPIVLVALQLVGVLKPQQLRDFRRFGIVIIFVIAAVITPSADPISLFALAVPMMIFYEISILIGFAVVRRRVANEVSSGA